MAYLPIIDGEIGSVVYPQPKTPFVMKQNNFHVGFLIASLVIFHYPFDTKEKAL